MKGRTTVGQYGETGYILKHSRYCDECAITSKERRWFLSIDGYYMGDFDTKSKAIDYVKAFDSGEA